MATGVVGGMLAQAKEPLKNQSEVGNMLERAKQPIAGSPVNTMIERAKQPIKSSPFSYKQAHSARKQPEQQ